MKEESDDTDKMLEIMDKNLEENVKGNYIAKLTLKLRKSKFSFLSNQLLSI